MEVRLPMSTPMHALSGARAEPGRCRRWLTKVSPRVLDPKGEQAAVGKRRRSKVSSEASVALASCGHDGVRIEAGGRRIARTGNAVHVRVHARPVRVVRRRVDDGAGDVWQTASVGRGHRATTRGAARSA